MLVKLLSLLICVHSVESFKCEVQVISDQSYIGCFVDTRNRLLPLRYQLNGRDYQEMENNRCVLYCKDQGYMYAGTEAHVACFCGDDPFRYGPDNVASEYIMNYDCDQKCAGDVMQICGGGWRLSIYSTGFVPFKQEHARYVLLSNNTKLTAMANQVLTVSSTIECAQYCSLSLNCKVFVISTKLVLYESLEIMCEGLQQEQEFNVYLMK